MRAVLSCKLPSFCWNTTLPKRSCLDASGTCLSLAKKNAASLKRGRITRSLPDTTCSGCWLSILETVMKAGSSAPLSASVRWKYFWCVFIAEIKAWAGTSRNAGSKLPRSAVGHSTKPVTSSSKSSDKETDSPSLASAMTCSAIRDRRSSLSTSTRASRSVSQ